MKDLWQWVEPKPQLLWCPRGVNFGIKILGVGEGKERKMLWEWGEEPGRKRLAQVPGSFTGVHPSALCCAHLPLLINPASAAPLSN